MRSLIRAVLAPLLLIGSFSATPAAAATLLFDQTLPYGQSVSDQTLPPVFGSFDLSSLAGAAIEYFEFTISWTAGSGLFPSELWFANLLGSNSSSGLDDRSFALLDPLSPRTVVLSTLTDFGPIDTFATWVANLRADFSLAELTGGRDSLNLGNVNLTAYGTASISAVPAPAAGLLLLSALGGIATLRRRKRSSVTAA